jgi:hypothetical protein
MTENDPSSRLIGYARVSNYGQTLHAQLGQLKAAGCARIFREKVTRARRPEGTVGDAEAASRRRCGTLKELAPSYNVGVCRKPALEGEIGRLAIRI